MKSSFRNIARSLFALTFIALYAATATHAQNREEHMISARAGGVNFVAGNVMFRHGNETNWQRLSSQHNLESGDVLKTGAGGQVEVLLNPGSYIRMADNSEFELTDTALDSLRLKLARGSVVIEATGYEKSEVEIAVATPQTLAKIVRSGIYRIDVLPSNVTEIAVRKGRALVGAEELLVKGGKLARIGGAIELAKLEKPKDALDVWSKERAHDLAEANVQLARRSNRESLSSAFAGMSYDNSIFRQGSGLWVFSRLSGCYTFLPFYPGWNSPYGSGYYSNMGFYPPPGYGYYYGGNPGYTGGGSSGGGSPNPSGGISNSGGGSSNPTAPREMPSTSMPHQEMPSRGSDGPRGRDVTPPRD